MGQVSITLNGGTYRLACADGDEQRLEALGTDVADRLAALVDEFGQVGDTRLLVMAALQLADDLRDAQSDAPKSKRDSKQNGKRETKNVSEDAA